MEWRFETAADIYPSSLRQEFLAALRNGGTADSDFASAELIFGELISNAIRHARGPVCVRLAWDGESPTLSVHDEKYRFERGFALPDDPLAESGRGLYIVNALAKEFRLTKDGSCGSAASAVLPIRRRA